METKKHGNQTMNQVSINPSKLTKSIHKSPIRQATEARRAKMPARLGTIFGGDVDPFNVRVGPSK